MTRRLGSRLLVVVVIVLTLAAPALIRTDPLSQDLSASIASPSAEHVVGTDQYGRDLGARLAHGARRTLIMALVAVAFGAGIGMVVGAVAGSGIPVLSWLIDRAIDVALGLPSLVLALAIVGALGPGTRNLVLAMIIGMWPWYARLAREHAVTVNQQAFVLAARTAGISEARIWTGHVLPHIGRRLTIVASLDIGYTIVAFAGLSFLGLGAAPPTPELGVILREGQDYLFDAPWLLWAPAAVVFVIVLPFVLASERLHQRGIVA